MTALKKRNQEMESSSSIRIAVRPLVEYVLRGGDLDSGFGRPNALVEGTRAHQQVQKEYGELDQREVYLSAELPCEELVFLVEGRCDGLLAQEDGSLMIDEIKSTSGELAFIEAESYPVHWAQAKCYAFMAARERGLTHMSVQLTYMQLPSGELKRFRKQFGYMELEAFVHEVVAGYAPYARLRMVHRDQRDQSIPPLAFPYPDYRAGQRKLAGAVYKSIQEKVNLFAKAPTGIGKTISTIFPAVKAIGEGHLQQIFYLTARTTNRAAAEAAFSLLVQAGLRMHVVTLTAKEKVCFQEKVSCRKEDCPFADGFYDRVNGAVLDILANETMIGRQVIEAYALKHRVCPFEFSLELAYAADAVICDYNYIYDPRVSLKRMLGEQKGKAVLLVDEAHHLVDRGRDMYSAEITKRPFLELQRAYKGQHEGVYRAAKTINSFFVALKKEADASSPVDYQKPETLLKLAEDFLAQAEQELFAPVAAGVSPESAGLLLETYFTANNFVRIGKLYDERYVSYTELTAGDVRLVQFCLDPSQLIREAGKSFRSSIFFSATLSPLHYFRDMLGASEEDYTLSVPSPFSREQLQVQIHPYSTRYRDRERTKSSIAGMLRKVLVERPGNYLLFFPSYVYMSLIYEEVAAELPDQVKLMMQTGSMTEEERESFLAAFQAEGEQTLAAFAVMGGIFSEGVDLVGDRLTGVAVIGVGLPQIGIERDLIRDYFHTRDKDGYDYAYVYPGMNKVLQAGGRLIRSERDQGLLMLVDDRYLQPHYAGLLPEEWK